MAQYVILIAESTSTIRAGNPVVSEQGIVDLAVIAEFTRESQQRLVADRLGQADLRIRIGLCTGAVELHCTGGSFRAAANGRFEISEQAAPQPDH